MKTADLILKAAGRPVSWYSCQLTETQNPAKKIMEIVAIARKTEPSLNPELYIIASGKSGADGTTIFVQTKSEELIKQFFEVGLFLPTIAPLAEKSLTIDWCIEEQMTSVQQS